MFRSSRKEKENHYLAFTRPPQNVKFGTYTLKSKNDGKEMYKKGCCTRKVVVLLIKRYCSFAVLVAVAVVDVYAECGCPWLPTR